MVPPVAVVSIGCSTMDVADTRKMSRLSDVRAPRGGTSAFPKIRFVRFWRTGPGSYGRADGQVPDHERRWPRRSCRLCAKACVLADRLFPAINSGSGVKTGAGSAVAYEAKHSPGRGATLARWLLLESHLCQYGGPAKRRKGIQVRVIEYRLRTFQGGGIYG